MQIVIEILEEQYNKIKELKMCEYGNYVALLDAVLSSIKNGTPLPNGHGRLADADILLEKMSTYSDDEGDCGQYGNDSIIAKDSACYMIEIAPTLIEADSK